MFDNLKKIGRRVVQSCKNAAEGAKKFALGVVGLGAGVSAMTVSGPAHAAGGGGLADAALAAITGLEADVQSILIILVGVVFLLVLYSFIKRAK